MISDPASVSDHARLAALYEVSRTLGASLNLDEALVTVMDAAIRLMGAERGYLVLRGEHTDRLEFCVTRNAKGETLTGNGFEVSRTTAEEVIRTGQPVLIGDAQTGERTAHKDSVLQYALRSILVVPLKTQGEVIGVMYLDNKAGVRLFDEEDLALLQTFADQTAIAIANARLFEAQKQEAEANRVLLELARLAQNAATVGELMRAVGQALPTLVDCDRCSLFLWDETAQAFRPAYFSFEEDPVFTKMVEMVRPEAVPLAGEVRERPGPFVVSPSDLAAGLPAEWVERLGMEARSFVVAPLRAGEQLIGALALDNRLIPRPFTPRALAIIEALSHQLATTIQKLQLFETVRHQLDELTLLHAIATAGAEATSEDALIERATQVMGETLYPDNFGVLLLDDQARVLRPHPSYRIYPKDPELMRVSLPLHIGINGRVAATGQPWRVPDVTRVPEYFASDPQTRSELCVPLKAGERILGVVNVESAQLDAFSEADERLLTTFAGQLAMAIEKLRLLEAERQQRELAEVLREVGAILSATLDLEALLDALLDQVARIVPYESGNVMLIENGWARVARARGYDLFGEDGARQATSVSFEIAATPSLRWMVETGQPHLIPDTAADPGWVKVEGGRHVRSWIGAPLGRPGEVVAFFSLDKSEPNFYRPEHTRLLAVFAGQAALALQNAQLFAAQQQRTAELETVRRATLSLTASLELPAVLEAILDATLKFATEAQDAHIFLYQPEAGGRLTFGASLWSDSRKGRPLSEPRPEGLTYTVARQGQPILVPDMRQHPFFRDAPHDWRGAIIGLPLQIGTQVVGVMNIAYPAPRVFPESELRVLRLLADQAAIAIENARLFESERIAREQAEALREVAGILNADLEQERLLRLILDQLARVVSYDSASVMLLSDRTLQIAAGRGFRSEHQNLTPFDLEGLKHLQALIESRRPLIIPDTLADPRWQGRRGAEYIRCWLGVPLVAQDHVIGLLNLDKEQPGYYTERDAELALAFANQAVLTLQNARLFEAERWQLRLAQTLQAVGALFIAQMSLAEVFESLFDLLAQVIHYDSVSVQMLDEEGHMVLAAGRGFPDLEQARRNIRMVSEQRPSDVWLQQTVMLIPDTRADARWVKAPGGEYILSWIGAALIVRGQLLGILTADSQTLNAYNAEDGETLSAFANQAAVAIENAQLHAETQRRLLEQTLLYECSHALTLAPDAQAAIAAVAERMVRHLGATAMCYYAYDAAADTIRLDYEHWAPAAAPREQQSVLGQGWPLANCPHLAAALHTRRPQTLRRNDAALTLAERDMFVEWDGQTIMAVPMAVHDRVLGYFEVRDSRVERLYDEADARLLLALANQAAVVIERLRLLEETRRREMELAILLDVARAVSSSLDFDEVMKQVATSTAQALRMEHCSISTYEPGAPYVHTLASYFASGRPSLSDMNEYFALSEYPATARVLEAGDPLVVRVDDPQADAAEVALIRQLGYALLLMLPLRASGQIVGLVELYAHDVQREFTSAEIHVARALADQAGVAVEHARLFQAEREQHELAEALRQVGTTLSATLDFNTVLDRLLDHIARVVPYDTASVMMVEGRRARVARVRGFERFGPEVVAEVEAMSFNIATTPNLRRMSESGRSLIIPDTTDYPGWAIVKSSMHIRSSAGAPIFVQGELIAFFTLDKTELNFYRPEHAERLEAFAGQAALALQNARLFEAERQRVAVLTALHETALDLSAQLDLYTLLQTIVERATRLMDATMGGLYLLRDDGQTLELRVAYHLPRDYAGSELKLGEGLAGRAAQTGKPLVVGNYATWPGRAAVYEGSGWESMIGVPIKWRERVLGVISVVDQKPHRFTSADAEMVSLFADKAAVAIVNARLFEETRRQTRELAGLYGTALATSSVLETKALLAGLYDQVDDLMAPDSFGVALYDTNTDEIEFVLAMERGRTLPEAQGLRVPVSEGGLTGWVVRTRQPLLLGDLKHDSLPVQPRHITAPARSWLGVPLIARDRIIGVVTTQSFRPQAFDESDRRFLESAASQVAVALENARLFEALVSEKGRLELLYTLSQNLTASLDPQEVAARALDLIRDALEAYKAEMFVLERGGDRLHLIAISGYETESVEALDRQLDLHVGQGLAGHTAVTRALAIVPAVAQDQHWVNVPGLDAEVRSAAAVPLMAGEELVGVLNLLSDRESFFRDEHLPVLRAIAVPVALALQNAQLFQAEARRAHHLASLNAITRTALEPRELQDLLQALAERLGELLDADACYMVLWDEARRQVIPTAAYGPFREVFATILPEPGEVTLTESVLQAEQALVADDALNTPHMSRHIAEQFNISSALGLPLIAGGQKLGAAIIAFTQPHHFTQDEVSRSEQAARQIALALAKARLLEGTRRHADEILAASDILRTLNAAPDVIQAFPAIVAGLRAITGCQRISLALLDEHQEWFNIIAVDPPPEVSLPARVRLPDIATTADAPAGRPHLTSDLAAEADFLLERSLLQSGSESRLNLPLHAGEHVIGILNLVWPQPNGYDPAHLPLLSQIADAVALAVEKKRLFDETRRRADELETLSSLSAIMRLAESTSEIMQIVLKRSLEVFHAEGGAIAVPGPDPDVLIIAHEEGWSDARRSVSQINNSIFGHVFRTGQPHLSPDIAADPLARPDASAPVWSRADGPHMAAIYAPIRTSEAVIGIIAVTAFIHRTFTQADLGLLTAIAEITGNALRRAGVTETLEQRVAARTRELADANERLKDLDRLKDQFVSNVSHELRTPITNLKLHLGLLEKRGPELLDRYLPILQRETERLRRLIEDLLNLSRLQAQALPPQRELHLLDALLAEVVAIHAMRAETRQVSLRHELNPGHLEVPMDRAQLLQVFTNLVGNAVAYTPAGGHITVTSAPEPDGPKEGTAVRIHNDRPVIPPDELLHLFDRFYRGSAAHESGEPGTGLGLSICKEIVERHGGFVEVTSREGEGTTFTVWLPSAPE